MMPCDLITCQILLIVPVDPLKKKIPTAFLITLVELLGIFSAQRSQELVEGPFLCASAHPATGLLLAPQHHGLYNGLSMFILLVCKYVDCISPFIAESMVPDTAPGVW